MREMVILTGADLTIEDVVNVARNGYKVNLAPEVREHIATVRKYMEDECQEAKDKGGSTLAAFQTKNLNMWVDAPEVWIPDDDVAACNEPVSDEDYSKLK